MLPCSDPIRLMLSGAALLLLCASTPLLGCGDPTDRPQDCTDNQFFDEAESLCRTCRALAVPTCRKGCPLALSKDANGCPLAECDPGCDACPPNTSFSTDTLSCEPLTCADSQTFDEQLNQCCPSPSTMPATCDDLDCDCTLTRLADASGCPITVCAQCALKPDPTPEQVSARVDDNGLCVPASATMMSPATP